MRTLNWMTVGLFAAGFLVCQSAFAVTTTTGLVTELNKNEVYEGLLAQDGYLFVGQLRANENEKHRVEVYAAQGGEKLTDIFLEHSASFIYPYSDREVLVVGRSSWPWKTHYTVIGWNGQGQFTKKTVTFPEEYQVNEFAGRAGKMFFNEPGSRGLFKLVGTRNLSSMNVEISGPGQMILDGETLWVLERKSFDYGDENVAAVDTRSNSVKRLFASDRQGLTDILPMKESDAFVASEYGADQVLFVSKKTGEMIATIPVLGGPRGLAQVGRCVVAMTDEAKTLSFMYVGDHEVKLIDVWDVSDAGDRLKQPRRVTVDPDSGRVFMRSNYPCPSCSTTQSSVFFAQQDGNETINKCMNR